MNRSNASVALLAAVLLTGCAGPNHEPEPAPSQPAPDAAQVNERTRVFGQSVERRPLELHLLGSGPRPLLVLAAIHGNERNSSVCAQLLLDHLRAHPAELNGRTVAIITAANPDGVARNLRFNAHRVDLNRNFPAANWSHSYASGPTAGSEPETKALLAIIGELNPTGILSIHSHATDPCNNFDGPAERVALAMTDHNGYPTMASIGYPTPGSLGSWAGVDRHIPIVTLELPASLPGPACWERNRDALLAFVQFEK
jgi:murein peptide amidase A